MVARRAHNPEVVGSSPAPATAHIFIDHWSRILKHTPVNNATLSIFLSFTILVSLVRAEEKWGDGVQVKVDRWEDVALNKFNSKKQQRNNVFNLKFISEDVELPFWFQKQSDRAKWFWSKPGSKLKDDWLDKVLGVNLGYEYLKPDLLRVSRVGPRVIEVEAKPWAARHWSKYRACHDIGQLEWPMPEDLRWLEAWQVSHGLRTVIWPVNYLRSYPRASALSSQNSVWRGVVQTTKEFEGIKLREITSYSPKAMTQVEESIKSWRELFESCRSDEGKLTSFGSISSKLKWEGKEFYPIIPLSLAGVKIDTLEVVDMKEMNYYRFLLREGFEYSHLMRGTSSLAMPKPNIFIEKGKSSRDDFELLKAGRWLSGGGFAFDFTFESVEGVKYRMGDRLPVSQNSYQPVFEFVEHPRFSSIVSVSLFKGDELMLRSLIPKDMTSVRVGLGRYYLEKGDVMTMTIQHEDGSFSGVNPIYVGERKNDDHELRKFPLRIEGLPKGKEVLLKNGLLSESVQPTNGILLLEVTTLDVLRLEVEKEEREVNVLNLWMKKVMSKMEKGSDFYEQYSCFERSFPLVFLWKK